MLLDFIVFILWIISIIGLVVSYSNAWLVLFVITLIYLFIRGLLFIGFDLDDLF